jgi:hypothetical protein
MKTFKQLREKCWDGWTQRGMKKKGTRIVPNCVKVSENFMDGKNPQDKGDMARHGLKGKSITQLKNEEIGTLPGDEMDKLKFHMMSFLDAFHKLIGEELTNLLIEFGIIKMEVFGAIRGRSFTNSILSDSILI